MYTEFNPEIDRYIWTSPYRDESTGEVFFKTLLFKFLGADKEDCNVLLEIHHQTQEAAYVYHDELAKDILLKAGKVRGIPPDDFYDLSFEDVIQICCPDDPHYFFST